MIIFQVSHSAIKRTSHQAIKLPSHLAIKPPQKMTYKDLIVWQKADVFAHQVYLKTRSFPKDELFGITSQIRRAALSVPTNIVEGYARKGDKELARFLNISIGSLAETEYLLGFANRLGYIDTTDFKELETLKDDVSKALWSFYKKVVSA